MAWGQSLAAVRRGMAECTPNLRASYDAAETTPRSSRCPPTTTALPFSSGANSSSTETKKASISTWKMVLGKLLMWGKRHRPRLDFTKKQGPRLRSENPPRRRIVYSSPSYSPGRRPDDSSPLLPVLVMHLWCGRVVAQERIVQLADATPEVQRPSVQAARSWRLGGNSGAVNIRDKTTLVGGRTARLAWLTQIRQSLPPVLRSLRSWTIPSRSTASRCCQREPWSRVIWKQFLRASDVPGRSANDL